MNAYTTHYERFKDKSKKGGGSRAGSKASKKSTVEKPTEITPPSEAVAAEIPISDPLVSPSATTIPDAENFFDLGDDDEEEEEGPTVF
jgi:hypothetical protein